jgi:predicted ATPase
MLTQLRVKNFRLLRDVTVNFENGLTVFVGPNSSGKSTVLEVLDFIARCADESLSAAIVAHGGFGSIRTANTASPIEIGTKWIFATTAEGGTGRNWHLEWTVALVGAANGRVIVEKETLNDIRDSGSRTIVSMNDKGERIVLPESTSDQEPSEVKSSGVLAFEAVKDENRYPGLWWLNIVAQQIRVLGSLTAPPAWARSGAVVPSPRDSLVVGVEPFLGRQGIGLANVLYNLSTDHRDAWAELERAFRGEFPFVQRIVFPPDPGGSKISVAVEDERFPGRKIYASEMSDGMVAFLSLLSAVLHPQQAAVLGLDEPDANIHPSALRRLLALAQRPHMRRAIAIVTHSNALLDQLSDAAKSIRVVEPTNEGAIIKTLDGPALVAWRTEYSLSEMRRTGLVDSANIAYGGGNPALSPEATKPKRMNSKRRPSKIG